MDRTKEDRLRTLLDWAGLRRQLDVARQIDLYELAADHDDELLSAMIAEAAQVLPGAPESANLRLACRGAVSSWEGDQDANDCDHANDACGLVGPVLIGGREYHLGLDWAPDGWRVTCRERL